MIPKILLLSENGDLINALKAVPDDTEIVALNKKAISYDTKAKADSVRIVIMDYNYCCVIGECIGKFVLFHRNASVPFILLRPSLFNITTAKLYHLSAFNDHDFSEHQEALIQKIRGSELSVTNPSLFIHPSNLIYKFMQFEKEIFEDPSKRTIVARLIMAIDWGN